MLVERSGRIKVQYKLIFKSLVEGEEIEEEFERDVIECGEMELREESFREEIYQCGFGWIED